MYICMHALHIYPRHTDQNMQKWTSISILSYEEYNLGLEIKLEAVKG